MSQPLLAALAPALHDRAGGACELCGGTDELEPLEVGPSDIPQVERAILRCATCRTAEPSDPHWFCLQGAVWNEVPAVQVAAYRVLHGLSEPWAVELLDSLYLEEAVFDWARSTLPDPDAIVVRDSNGTALVTGDAVTLIKDLPVKGANFTAKRGTLVKNIRVGEDPTHVEGKVSGQAIYLKTEFLKKA